MNGRILIVDDDSDTATALAELLRRRGFDAQHVTSGSDCLDQLARYSADVVVTDVLMLNMSGLELCQALRTLHPEVLTIMLTGRGGLDLAVSAIRVGAYDYLTKPVPIAALEVSLMRALAHVELRRELMRLREAVVVAPLEMITLAEMQRRYVREVLDATAGNKTRAARLLGIDRRSLYRRLSALQDE